MPIARLPSLFISLLITLACSVPGHGQIENEKIFAAVPIVQRARFIARLNLYIEYSLKDQPEKLLTFYDEDTVCSLCKGKSKCTENCAPPMVASAEGYRAVLVGFKPREVKPYKHDAIWNYYIEVDQKERVSWKGKPSHIVESRVRLFAVFQSGDWFFSLVSIGGLIKL